jgi:hypothetical protein
MPGVYRPTTLIDVLSTLNQGLLPPVQATDTTQLGVFAEIDETIPMADSMTTNVAAPATWDNGVWGATTWS